MNDIEKAIEDLDTLKNCCKYNYDCGTCEICYKSIPKAQEALEKQIPKKPIKKSWSISKCPSCNTNLGEWLEDGYHNDWDNLKVCDCGQKLDWSEVEDE